MFQKFIRYIVLYIFLGIPSINSNGQDKGPDELDFEFFYETLEPVKLKSAVLYTLPSILNQKPDTVEIDFRSYYTDTFTLINRWKYPTNAYFIFQYEDIARSSNNFYLEPNRNSWEIFVNDTSVIVKPKPKVSFTEKDSFMAIIVIIQGAIELILALFFYKIFRWPSWILLLVLVANLCAFPIFLLKIKPLYLNEIIMFVIKFLVILFTGRRKLGIYRIIILSLVLSFISFGFKAVFLLFTKFM